jgi:hypothetical protein
VEVYQEFLKVASNEVAYLLYDKYMRILEVVEKMEDIGEMRSCLRESVRKLMSNSRDGYQ